jgi:hypothetical protein
MILRRPSISNWSVEITNFLHAANALTPYVSLAHAQTEYLTILNYAEKSCECRDILPFLGRMQALLFCISHRQAVHSSAVRAARTKCDIRRLSHFEA